MASFTCFSFNSFLYCLCYIHCFTRCRECAGNVGIPRDMSPTRLGPCWLCHCSNSCCVEKNDLVQMEGNIMVLCILSDCSVTSRTIPNIRFGSVYWIVGWIGYLYLMEYCCSDRIRIVVLWTSQRSIHGLILLGLLVNYIMMEKETVFKLICYETDEYNCLVAVSDSI